MTLTLGILALSVDDYASRPSLACEIVTGVVVFVALWILEFALRLTVPPFLAQYCSLPCLNDKYRTVLGRVATTSVAMALISWMGYDAIVTNGGFTPLLNIIPLGEGSSNLQQDVHAERLYAYIPAAQRVALFHAAWEVKNFVDSLLHNDGPVFIAHHIAAFLVSVGCMSPIYQPYAGYFFGFSEISSVVLPVVGVLDDTVGMGPPELGDSLPITKMVTRGLFVVLFLVFRIVLWMAIAYRYVQDGLAVLNSSSCQSEPLLYCFLGGMMFFTFLQFMWLVQSLKGVLFPASRAIEADKKSS